MLVVVSGPDRGRSFPLLEGQTLQVGRSQATATRLSDPTASRVHCEVEWDGRKAVVINISTSGTLVNRKAVAQHDLEAGDVLRVGSSELRFQRRRSECPLRFRPRIRPGGARVPAAVYLLG
jgi:pSer/pThr/pTyr-binding forkhead associated (FHA) protein